MKISIKTYFSAVYIAIMVITISCSLVVNRFFLEKYYTEHKQNILQQVYSFMNTRYDWEDVKANKPYIAGVTNQENDSWSGIVDENNVLDDTDRELLQLCSRDNIFFLVLDSMGDTLKTNVYNVNPLRRQLLEAIFFANSGDNSRGQLIQADNNFLMMKVRDIYSNIEFIEMWGFLSTGDFFILRTPCESLSEAAEIANSFLMHVSVSFIIIGAIITYLISSKITGPIRELTNISEKMARLDFDTKYQKTKDDEIGQLGENMNILSTTLEKTISELKTANLELKKDVEQKEKTDEMRREFLSNVSHELKTPLALIQGYAEGLTDMVDDKESRDFYCDVIIDETRRMNRLVQSLLSLDNIESGSETPVMERLDISEMIKNIASSMDIFVKQKDIKLSNDVEDNLHIWCDRSRCEEILRNYMSNAINHVTDGGSINIKSHMGENGVRISFFNTGDPIPEENLPHIWEKFYKVDKARTREYGGSGVGLSIVKAACESMNMKYGVINRENGVEFWFETAPEG